MQTKIPPPFFALGMLILMWLVDGATGLTDVSVPLAGYIGSALAIIGFGFAFSATRLFSGAKTTINPMAPKEASSLVSAGIYNYTRNPMYLGLLLLLTGFAIWLGDLVNILILFFFVWYMTKFQIKPEEEALIANFGDEYEAYRRKVRRWI
jgi:protein-S-isoprenylcysteine O-methyltransferase Ste14